MMNNYYTMTLWNPIFNLNINIKWHFLSENENVVSEAGKFKTRSFNDVRFGWIKAV